MRVESETTEVLYISGHRVKVYEGTVTKYIVLPGGIILTPKDLRAAADALEEAGEG